MTEEEFLIQYELYLKGKLDEDEIRALHAYQDEMSLDIADREEPGAEEIKQAILARLQNSMQPAVRHQIRRRPGRLWWAVAAMLAGLSAGVIYTIQLRNAKTSQGKEYSGVSQPDSRHERRTYLTLANGKQVSLSDAADGPLASSAGVLASKRSGSILSYSQQDTKTAIPDTNSIVTPAGEQFAVTLADGSRVYLNAGTSLRFPVFFGGRREVYLTGEACFEVSADASNPFIVHVNGESVKALGTMFNIKAHTEENTASVTLVRGAVNVALRGKEQTLRIGQQLNYKAGQTTYSVKDVNTDIVIAWKEGYFAFDRESITSIMAEIGRWYNMKVIFAGGNVNRKFSGKIMRFTNITDVLRRLEMTGAMKFSIQKNTIVVTIGE
ncbi:FecR family protein [Chitinophaga sp. YR627]|uniref:FecR family protein n=1 Tax=Chitinophaga sp. YR627 TaxID=1881041 RepID=UPI0008EA6E8A|nr:FecR family protein [Chitinophaga sp. YR627]SFN23124.1 FecR family protein [Chitinophaga sp. YR627]